MHPSGNPCAGRRSGVGHSRGEQRKGASSAGLLACPMDLNARPWAQEGEVSPSCPRPACLLGELLLITLQKGSPPQACAGVSAERLVTPCNASGSVAVTRLSNRWTQGATLGGGRKMGGRRWWSRRTLESLNVAVTDDLIPNISQIADHSLAPVYRGRVEQRFRVTSSHHKQLPTCWKGTSWGATLWRKPEPGYGTRSLICAGSSVHNGAMRIAAHPMMPHLEKEPRRARCGLPGHRIHL